MKWYLGENDVEKEPPKDGFFRILYLVVNFPGKLFIILALMPYSILVPMIIGNSLYGLISCSIICPVIKRRITDPYEEAVKTSTSTY